MKQKYVVLRDDEKNELHIREFAELDKEILSLLCGETYDIEAVRTAMSGGRTALIGALRTQNMYPPGIYAEKIADAVTELLTVPDGRSASEVLLDDMDYVTRGRVETEITEDIDEEAADIDDLLVDDTIDEEFADDEDINIAPNSSIKIADDDALDIEEDV